MKIKATKIDVLSFMKNVGLVMLGTLVLSFGTAIFLIPFNLVTGGVSGIALVIENMISSEIFTVDLIVTILTWALFFVGLICLGWSFAAKTLISTVVYPLGVSLFLRLASPDVLGGFFYLAGDKYDQISLIIAAVAGGLFVGVGCALSFIGGGSTGGVDVISFVICKIFKRLKSSVVIFAIDATIVLLGMFVIGDLVLTLLGVLSAFITALMIEKVFLGGSKAYIAHIITDKYDEINAAIIEKLDRTTTILDATGGYTKQGKKMVMVSFSMRQYAELMNIMNKIDKHAFMTIHKAHEINGEGWTR